MSRLTSSFVKSEPRDVDMTEIAEKNNYFNSIVKNESTDERNLLERGLPSLHSARQVLGPFTQGNAVSFGSNSQKPKQENAEIGEPALVINPQFKVFRSVSDIRYDPESALKEGIGMVKTIKEALKQLELGSKLRQDVWDREIENLQGHGSPKTLIAVCGATGAGKSSILNAILNDNIVPTSGMRACTAVVTELSYHKKQSIDADISFLSQAEWKDELAVLLHDIVDEEGNVKRLTDLKSDAGVAWQKVHAVYPKLSPEALTKMDVNQLINHDQEILKVLGVTKQISAKDAKAFAKEIGKYIDSKDQKQSKKDKKDKKEKARQPGLLDIFGRGIAIAEGNTASTSKSTDDSAALWPLIRQVNVRCRAKALSTGAVLVDLPGVADANAARNSIAKDYMKKCNCVWILAPITRAVDDKTARDLLGDAFKIQLMNGNYDDHTITFIASKCDDISCSEVIQALKLEEDPVLEDIEDRLRNFRNSISNYKKEKNAVDRVIKELRAQIKEIKQQIRDDREHIKALNNGEEYKLVKKKTASQNKKRKNTSGGQKSSKRRRSVAQDSNDDFLDDDSEDLGSSDSSSSVDSEEGSTNDDDSDVEMLSDNDSDDSSEEDDIEEITVDKLQQRIKEAKSKSKAINEQLNTARDRKKELSDSLSSSEKGAAKVQKEKNGFCSLKRSEFSRGVLKEDFRTGLKDLDDANAEARDPEIFDPSHNIRDYEAIDLPVFTCSSRDYVRLKGQVKGDGASTCFSNVEDTGIPALQKWCHQLTIASRERAARSFLTHVKAFAQSIQTYVEGNNGVTANDREHLRRQWESQAFGDHSTMENDPLNFLQQLGNGNGVNLYSINPKVDAYGEAIGITPRLCKRFAEIVDKCVNDLKQNFKDGLEAKCAEGAAAGAALITLDDFTSSMHWHTYRATLRRHGSWRRDLNVELTNPFTKSIAHSWSQVFESDLFAPFQLATLEVIKLLVKEVEYSAVPGLQDRAKMQGNVCVEEACLALAKTVDLVKATMTNEQKEVSRCVAPHVQTQLVDGYDRAMEERGPGSVARQKALFRAYLQNCKDHIFDDGANVILDRLTAAADAIGETLDGAMGNLAQKIEVSLAVLWEGTRDSPAQLRIREAVVDVVETVQQQVKLWMDADTTKHQADEATADAMDHD